MKPIIYETRHGNIHPEIFDVMIDKQNEYIPVLSMVVDYNTQLADSKEGNALAENSSNVSPEQHAGRAQEVQLFLDNLNP